MPPDMVAAQAEQNFTCFSGQQQVTAAGDLSSAIDALNTGLMGQCPEQGMVAAADGAIADFALTSSAPNDAEQKAYTDAACKTGKLLIAPAFAYGIGLAVNGPGMESVVLPPDVLAGILNGSITSWVDPKIAAANDGVDLSSMGDITVVSLEGPDGSVRAMTTYLNTSAPTVWTTGVADTLSVGTKVATTDDLLAELSNAPGAVAVLPLPVAANNSLAVMGMQVQNQTMDATNTQQLQIGAGATSLTIAENGNIFAAPAIGGVPNADTFDAAAQKIVVASGELMIGWPILGFAHVMACNTGATPPLAMSSFLYTVTLNGQGAVAAVGYTPLPEPVRSKSRTLAASNNPSQSAAAGGAASPAPVVSDEPAVSDEPMASGSASPVTS
jgi:phosphate transport system substrate-binding protein